MLSPKQATDVTAVVVANADGWVMVIVLVEVQEFPSVTVTVFTPAVCPVITDVVAAVLHK